jgi:hypothetical protein
MKLETGFLAQAADVLSDGRIFVHGGGIEGFSVAGAPVLIPSISIVLRFQFSPEECGAEYHLRITLTDSNGADCGVAATSILNPQAPLDFPDRVMKLFAVFAFTNLVFPRMGLYTVNVFVNGSRLDGFTVGIIHVRPPVDEVR